MTQPDDYLPELPPPVAVAEQLVERSWADDLDDRDRLLHEQAARTIRRMMRRERVLKGLLREARRASP
jgi:hypothetical protein